MDDDLIGCALAPFSSGGDRLRASAKQWLIWLAGGLTLVVVLYAVFRVLGYE